MNDTKIIRCKNCLLPNTKPSLQFVNGICSGCQSYEKRKDIDWAEREDKFLEIVKKAKKDIKGNYHCIIPCSGGKDSYFQTLKILEHGLNPLCVVASTQKLSKLGRKNIDNLKKLGVDVIEYSVDPMLRRKIDRFTLETVGDISWSEHITIWTIPARISVNLNIPLIIWGENSENENGGPLQNQTGTEILLDRKYIDEFGGLCGLRTSDISEILDLPKEKLLPYTYPEIEKLEKIKSRGIFLGQFFPWDGYKNANLAKKYGFSFYEKNELEGSIVNYENLDNLYMRIHDYFKYLKFGYDRVTDWCSWHIRRKRLSREEALKINQEKCGHYPKEYMGVKLEKILEEINMSKAEFDKICLEYTNKNIFKSNNDGNLIISEDKRLILNE